MEYMEFDTVLSVNQIVVNIENNISNESLFDKNQKIYYELAGSVNFTGFKLHDPDPFFMRRYNRVEITGKIIDLGTERKVSIKININFIGLIFLYIFFGVLYFTVIDSIKTIIPKIFISLGFIFFIILTTFLVMKRIKKDYKYYKKLLFRWILQ